MSAMENKYNIKKIKDVKNNNILEQEIQQHVKLLKVKDPKLYF